MGRYGPGAQDLNFVEYEEFCKWREKKQKQKDETAISTGGHLMTDDEHMATLDEKEQKKITATEKAAARAEDKEQKAREKIIVEHEQEQKKKDRLEKESAVRDLMIHFGSIWTTRTVFLRLLRCKPSSKRIVRDCAPPRSTRLPGILRPGSSC